MTELFTKQEKIFICFLLFGVLAGGGLELYQSNFKTISKITQNDSIEDIEKEIHERATLIDSLLDERTIAVDEEKIANTNKETSTKEANPKSNQTSFPVEINRATFDELVRIPQIGRVIANRIIEYRSTEGEFKDIEELIQIKGIGEKKLKAIKQYIYIEQNQSHLSNN